MTISAIVAMSDSGGSTGVLRDELGVLPPGDVRQCLAALARSTTEVRELFSYRFSEGGLAGHNMGNLFLSALEKTTGSFSRAVAVAGKILNVYGRVIPVTEGDMQLVVTLRNGTVLHGENHLDDNEQVRSVGVRAVAPDRPVTANPAALAALTRAHVVVIGPGDLYGSIIPNLLVGGMAQALRDTSARIVVVANLTNKKGLTDGFSADDYVRAIAAHIPDRSIDALVYNTTEPDARVRARYEAQEGAGAFVAPEVQTGAYECVGRDLLSAADTDAPSAAHAAPPAFIRHDSKKLAAAIVEYTYAP